MDYFLARYYSSAQGRFTSVDPSNAGARPSDAQSWNAFAYSRNNPLKYVDPDGAIYKLCDADGHCQYISDENAEQWKKQDGVVFNKNGNIYDKEGNKLGTFRRVWDDSASDLFNQTFYGREGLVARSDAMQQSIAGFAVVTTAGGAIAGVTAFAAPAALPFIAGAVEKVSVTGPSIAVTLLSKAQDPKLRNIIDNLYRVVAKIGSGSSADAFRADGSHAQKLADSIRGLENVLKNPNLSQTDRDIANYLINDMKNALTGK